MTDHSGARIAALLRSFELSMAERRSSRSSPPDRWPRSCVSARARRSRPGETLATWPSSGSAYMFADGYGVHQIVTRFEQLELETTVREKTCAEVLAVE
jgi:hypothetical protein